MIGPLVLRMEAFGAPDVSEESCGLVRRKAVYLACVNLSGQEIAD